MRKMIAFLTALASAAVLFSCGDDSEGTVSSASSSQKYEENEEETTAAEEEKAAEHLVAMEKYIEAVTTGNTETYVRFLLPSSFLDTDDYTENYEDIDDSMKEIVDNFKEEYGDDYTVSVKSIDTDRELTEEELEAVRNYYESELSTTFDIAFDRSVVTKGHFVTATITINGSLASDEEDLECCVVYFNGDGWKIINDDIENITSYYGDNDTNPYEEETTAEPTTIDPAEINLDVPDYIKNYTAPTELGTDITNGNVEIDGKVYTFPMPVQELLDDGWVLSESFPEYIEAGSEASSNITKNDFRIYITCSNFADYITVPENCLVTYISPYDTDNVPMILPGGITYGSTKEEADSVITDEFDYSNSTSNWSYEYNYREDDISRYVRFSVDKETKLVNSITLSYYVH